MARNKLIAKYSALNNEKLPQRIYDKIKSFIESEGIEELPYRELSGRWTGKLDISNGGWRNDFDLLCPIPAMCRVNRHGEVLPDMAKINACVQEWVNFLTMPTEDDEYLGASDETFSDSGYLPDDINEFQSAAYAAEIKSFMIWRNSKNYLTGKNNPTKAGWNLSMTYVTVDSENFRKITTGLPHPMTSPPT